VPRGSLVPDEARLKDLKSLLFHEPSASISGVRSVATGVVYNTLWRDDRQQPTCLALYEGGGEGTAFADVVASCGSMLHKR
jgi:hypothetical protein